MKKTIYILLSFYLALIISNEFGFAHLSHQHGINNAILIILKEIAGHIYLLHISFTDERAHFVLQMLSLTFVEPLNETLNREVGFSRLIIGTVLIVALKLLSSLLLISSKK